MTLVNTDTGEVVARSAESYAEQTMPHLSAAVEEFVAVGRIAIEAKAALPHGEFGRYCELLDMSERTVRRFMTIARNPVIANRTHASDLPSSWATLAEIARLDPEDIEEAIAAGDITPATTRRDVRELFGTPTTPTAEEIAPELTDSDDPVAEAQAILDTLDDPTDEAVADAVEEANESRRTPSGPPTKPDLGGGVSHPARYSRELMPVLADAVPVERFRRVLDPFAGTGRIHELPNETVGIEIEPEWADLHPDTLPGSALALPFADCSFDAIVTSPTYGNRLADSHNASDPERRRSYTHDLGRQLSADNSGAMQWGGEYRAFHEDAWTEAVRVLRPGGRFVLNIKDHVRNGEVQHVSAWHLSTLMLEHQLELVEIHPIGVRSLRAGANGEARTTEEFVFVLEAS